MLSLSYAQFRLGETEAATKSLVEAIKTEPDNFAALKMAATAKYGQAALQQAEAYFNEELKKDAKSPGPLSVYVPLRRKNGLPRQLGGAGRLWNANRKSRNMQCC